MFSRALLLITIAVNASPTLVAGLNESSSEKSLNIEWLELKIESIKEYPKDRWISVTTISPRSLVLDRQGKRFTAIHKILADSLKRNVQILIGIKPIHEGTAKGSYEIIDAKVTEKATGKPPF